MASLPTIYFLATGGTYWVQAKWYANFLSIPKCEGGNLQLEKAHKEAWGLWNQCIIDEKEKNHGKALMLLPNLQSCPNFKSTKAREGVKNWRAYEAPETLLR